MQGQIPISWGTADSGTMDNNLVSCTRKQDERIFPRSWKCVPDRVGGSALTESFQSFILVAVASQCGLWTLEGIAHHPVVSDTLDIKHSNSQSPLQKDRCIKHTHLTWFSFHGLPPCSSNPCSYSRCCEQCCHQSGVSLRANGYRQRGQRITDKF